MLCALVLLLHSSRQPSGRVDVQPRGAVTLVRHAGEASGRLGHTASPEMAFILSLALRAVGRALMGLADALKRIGSLDRCASRGLSKATART